MIAWIWLACSEPEPSPVDTDPPVEVDDDTDGLEPIVADTGPRDTGDGVNDPLSRPTEPTLSLDDFVGAAECSTCHPDHYAQWRGSLHAHAMVDPVFQALVAVRQADFDGEEDAFCTQCHSAIGVRSGDIAPGFSFDALDPITMEGVTCEACHTISAVDRTWNAGHTLDATGPMRGCLDEPEESSFHETEFTEVFREPELCGSCHDVIELSGLNLERPYEEWLSSPASETGQTCQDCHMPPWSGQAALGGPQREELHDHRFVGAEVPLGAAEILDAGELAALEEDVAELMEGAASMYLEVPGEAVPGQQLDVLVTVQNDIEGHHLPTGSTFVRQLWVELTVTDAAGTVLYKTGDLDDNGDLRDHWSELDPYGDDDLLVFHSSLVDERGDPTIFTWHASEHRTNAIPALYQRTATLFVPVPADAVGPLTLETRLRFRSHPPFLLRLVELDELIDEVVIRDLADDVLQVELAP